MKIQLAEHYGLCFGVRDAIAQAEQLAASGPLTILGELVHNPVVRDRLASHGVQEGQLNKPDTVTTSNVMITAHGASDEAKQKWAESGVAVADGTCPLVRHAHTQLRLLVEAGCQPVVIGKRGHVEVNGLTEDFSKAFVLEHQMQISELPPAARYGVISQTTQPIEHVESLVAAIREQFPKSEVIFRDTVCQPTKNRQLALKKLLSECATLVVVGGHNSNNTLQLVAAGMAAGLSVHHIERAEDLRAEWFKDSQNVGLTAGTSTLKETVAAVYETLKAIARMKDGKPISGANSASTAQGEEVAA